MVKKQSPKSVSVDVIKDAITPIEKKAATLVINNEKSMTEAVTMLSEVNKKLDTITDEKEKVTKPLNEALKAERGRWKPAEIICENVIATLRRKITTYQTEQSRLAKIEEEKIAARVGSGKGHLSVDTAVRKIEEIERPSETVETDSGKVKFRTVQRLSITNEDNIPRRFLVPDEAAILKALKAGEPVPGAEIVEEQVPINFR